jgi:hypothetical protein
MPASLHPRRRRTRRAGLGRRRLPGLAGMGIGAVVLLVWLAAPAVAQAADPTLGQVIDRLRNVLVGLLVGLATLFLTVGGLRYLFAGVIPARSRRPR